MDSYQEKKQNLEIIDKLEQNILLKDFHNLSKKYSDILMASNIRILGEIVRS